MPRTVDARQRLVAETKGFEPSRRFPACTLSRGVPSTTRPHLRRRSYRGQGGKTRRKHSPVHTTGGRGTARAPGPEVTPPGGRVFVAGEFVSAALDRSLVQLGTQTFWCMTEDDHAAIRGALGNRFQLPPSGRSHACLSAAARELG